LTLAIQLPSTNSADWLDFLHYARFIRRAKVSLHIRRRVGRDATTGDIEYQPYFPAIAGGVASHPDGRGSLQHLIDALLDRVSGLSRSRQEIFVPGQLIPFAVLFLDDVPAGARQNLLYRIENFFRSDGALPELEAEESIDPGRRLCYAKDQYFLFSLDGTAFVAMDALCTPFFRETLPANLASQYFLLFQFALFQRFTLMRIAEEIVQGWHHGSSTELRQRELTLRSTRDQLLSFTAAGYFSQVVQGHRQHTCYRTWQNCFQIDDLYERTRQSLTDMQEFLAARQNEQMQADFQQLDLRMRQLALVLGPPALCLSFVGIASWTNIYLAIGALIVGLALGWIAWRLVQKPARRSDDLR
jgi:hypothetical protein